MQKFWDKVGSSKGIIKWVMISVVGIGGVLLLGNTLLAPIEQEMLPCCEPEVAPETEVDEIEE